MLNVKVVKCCYGLSIYPTTILIFFNELFCSRDPITHYLLERFQNNKHFYTLPRFAISFFFSDVIWKECLKVRGVCVC